MIYREILCLLLLNSCAVNCSRCIYVEIHRVVQNYATNFHNFIKYLLIFKSFHWHTQPQSAVTFQTVMIEDPITPQTLSYTTL